MRQARLAALCACITTLAAPGLSQAATPLSPASYATAPVCSEPTPGQVGCLSERLTSGYWTPSRLGAQASQDRALLSQDASPAVNNASPITGSYSPATIEEAYGLPKDTSAAPGQLIAIVDAYSDPDIASDLATYSSEWGLPACTTTSGCLTIVSETGSTTSLPSPEGGWASEESLDVETAHGICPQCHLALVEASSTSFKDVETAVAEAHALGATEISNSYGGAESPALASDTGYDYPGTAVVAAAGDYGYDSWMLGPGRDGTPDYPASSPDVVAVGGTSLAEAGGAWGSTVWDSLPHSDLAETGGGCSTVFTAPAWQRETAAWPLTGCGSARLDSDVSADGDPYTGLAIYDSYPDGSGGPTGWTVLGGTSAATPIVAAEFALAGGAQGVAYPAQTLYSHLGDASDLYDVAQGTNDDTSGFCAATPACTAAAGYDGPSGVGSPLGLGAFSPSATSQEAPSSQSPPLVSDQTGASYASGDVLTASTGSWGGSAPISYSYQWLRCGAEGSSCAPVAGASGAHYTLGTSDIGHALEAQVTAKNDQGQQQAVSAPTPLVAAPPTAPVATGSPSASGTWRDGGTVAAQKGSWSSTTPISAYSYQWLRCDAQGSSCSPIASANSSSYALTPADVGGSLQVTVTATNAAALSASATSAPSPVVGGVAPAESAPPVISGDPEPGGKLEASAGTWSSDDGAVTYSYQWYSCQSGACTPLSGATSPRLEVSASDESLSLEVTVTATNAAGSSAEVSAPVVIGQAGRLRLASGTLRASHGSALARVSCQGGPCQGALALERRKGRAWAIVGHARYSLAAGGKASIKVPAKPLRTGGHWRLVATASSGASSTWAVHLVA
jgi:hypothetical protein